MAAARRRLLVCAVAAAAPSCALSAEVLEVPVQGALALLVVTIPEGGPAEVVALALDGEAAQIVSLPPRAEPRSVYVLRYPCTLASLGLTEGRLEVAVEGPSRPIPEPDSAIVAMTRGATRSAWTAISPSPLPAEVAALGLALPAEIVSPCLSFDIASHRLPVEEGDFVTVALPLGDDRALIGTKAGRFFRVSRGALVELAGLGAGTPRTTSFATDAGELWLIGGDTRVLRGDLERGFEQGPSVRSEFEHAWVSSAPSGDLEAFLVTSGRVIEHFDGEAWSILDSVAGSTIAEGGIAWVAPGEAIAVGHADRALVRYRGERSVREELPLGMGDYPITVASLAAGELAGSRNGLVFRKEDGTWRLLATAHAGRRVRVILPLPGGAMMYGGTGGIFQQYFEGFGVCDVTRIAPDNVHNARVLETEILFVSRSDIGEYVQLARAVPRVTPPMRCGS